MRTMIVALAAMGVLAAPAAQAQRHTSIDRGPGRVDVDRRYQTRGGGEASVSRSVRWGDGQVEAERRITRPDGRTYDRDVTLDRTRHGVNYTVRREGPAGNERVVQRWRRIPPPRDYGGPRRGYYFAPGYGYYPVPARYWGYRWGVGVVVPVPMRRYVIVTPGAYGLAPPPPGFGWVYLDTRVALVRLNTGVIVRLSPPLW